jgi:ribosomal protein L9
MSSKRLAEIRKELQAHGVNINQKRINMKHYHLKQKLKEKGELNETEELIYKLCKEYISVSRKMKSVGYMYQEISAHEI